MNQKLLVPISLLAGAAITFPALAQVTYPDDAATDTTTTRDTGQGSTTDATDDAMDFRDEDTTPSELPSTGGGGMAR